jgi:hypothetical protein
MFLVFMLVAVVISASPVHAATFGDMFLSVGESVNALGGFARITFGVLGFACIGTGLVKIGIGSIYGRKDSPDSKDWWIGILYWILAGAGLLCLSAFGMMASDSLGLTGTIDF